MMIFFLSLGLASQSALPSDRHFIGRIHVRRQRREFGGAGVDALEAGPDVQRLARGANVVFLLAGQLGQARIGKAHRLEAAQAFASLGKPFVRDVRLDGDDGFDLAQEPGIIAGDLLDFVQRKTVAHRLGGD